MEETARSVETVQALLERGDRRRLVDLLTAAHPADVAALLRDLPLEAQVTVFRLLSAQRAGEVLSELDDQTLLQLVQALDQLEVSRILDEMPPDHAAEAIEEIRKSAPEGRGFELYVVDDHRHLVGVVPLRRLLTAAPTTPMWAIRDPSVVSVSPETDQEEVARLVAKYDLVSVPVTDKERRLLGTISVEDVIDVLGEEASEDIFRLAGSDASELERRSPREIALMRLPWILTTLLIELGAGIVIHYYDATLTRVILLASFMPVIQAISGNTGLQSVTMVVRGLATVHVQLARWWEPLLRQIQTTSIIGAVCGVVVGILGAVWHGTVSFGLVVAVSMFISVNLSGAAGTAIPMVSKSLGFDPALTAGPFETALQDVPGVTIFLGLATALLRFLA